MPWDNHPGGIFHVKNSDNTVGFGDGRTVIAWDVDGTNQREITTIATGEEVVFVTSPDCSRLFDAGRFGFTDNRIANWEFGQYTNVSSVTNMKEMFQHTEKLNADISNWDVSNVTDMAYMFYYTPVFNSDISNWDVSNVTDMSGMFSDTPTFNQDLSQWCVSKIPFKPTSFDDGADAWTEPRPVWGTCP